MTSSTAIRFLSSRRGLIALAISLATVYTLTLYDAAAFASLTATATRPGSVSSSDLPAGKVGERKWTWGNGAGIMGDTGSSSRHGDAALPVGGMPHQRYRADEDPILAIAGVRQQDVEDGAAKPPANHRARPFGKTEDALKPADREEVEKAKAKAGLYAPHEVARLDAELAQAQAPKKAKAADVKGVAAAKKQKAAGATTQTESAQKTDGAGVDESSGSAPMSAAEDALEDAPNVAAKKGAANAAPMAALVLPADRNKEAIAIPTDDAKDSSSTTATSEPASHAAAKGASSSDDKAVPPSEKNRQPEKDAAPIVADDIASDASTDDTLSNKKAAAGEKPKIGTGGRVVKPVAADVVQKPAAAQREKAGKVVKQEAGKRVGTGARPGAKGMGMRRRRLVRRA